MAHKADFNRISPSFRNYSVTEVLPQYFTSEYPNLISFLEGYYEYIDSDQSISSIHEMFSLYDIESTRRRGSQTLRFHGHQEIQRAASRCA